MHEVVARYVILIDDRSRYEGGTDRPLNPICANSV